VLVERASIRSRGVIVGRVVIVMSLSGPSILSNIYVFFRMYGEQVRSIAIYLNYVGGRIREGDFDNLGLYIDSLPTNYYLNIDRRCVS